MGTYVARLCCTWSMSTVAYVSIRQHTSAYVAVYVALVVRLCCTWSMSTVATAFLREGESVYVSIRQHTSAYVSIRQHTSAYLEHVNRRNRLLVRRQTQAVGVPYTSAYVSIRQQSSSAHVNLVHASEPIQGHMRHVLLTRVHQTDVC